LQEEHEEKNQALPTWNPCQQEQEGMPQEKEQ